MSNSDLLKLRLIVKSTIRLDQALLQELRTQNPALRSLSRAQLKTHFRASHVLLQGRPANASMELSVGIYEIGLERWDDFLALLGTLRPATECFLPIIYEDADLLVLHKFSGVPSVSLTADETRSAAAAALAHFPGLARIPEARPLEPGLIHRLDTGTSGLLVFAKSADEFARLKAQWKTPTVVKTYRAIVEAAPKALLPRPCTISDPMARTTATAKKMIAIRSNDPAIHLLRGKPLRAVTHIRKVRDLGNRRFDLEIDIETGVMHQIRCHLSSYGWPILGDLNYRGAAAERLHLHAWKLRLPLKSGTVLQLESLLPECFRV